MKRIVKKEDVVESNYIILSWNNHFYLINEIIVNDLKLIFIKFFNIIHINNNIFIKIILINKYISKYIKH